ncbi:hypothetical protein QBC46DRAFT_407862 [Diplogelasinospora grovesii]|uniref:Uncharacterized protein n=1 Tax=Diplogelasinospora grovesii TaxID=303347 RepID=A0AAN6S5J0_9PEZI|nr:hypothetical protein QBC46DRAFT_407862 [Diplogelasinospora grovesii]
MWRRASWLAARDKKGNNSGLFFAQTIFQDSSALHHYHIHIPPLSEPRGMPDSIRDSRAASARFPSPDISVSAFSVLLFGCEEYVSIQKAQTFRADCVACKIRPQSGISRLSPWLRAIQRLDLLVQWAIEMVSGKEGDLVWFLDTIHDCILGATHVIGPLPAHLDAWARRCKRTDRDTPYEYSQKFTHGLLRSMSPIRTRITTTTVATMPRAEAVEYCGIGMWLAVSCRRQLNATVCRIEANYVWLVSISCNEMTVTSHDPAPPASISILMVASSLISPTIPMPALYHTLICDTADGRAAEARIGTSLGSAP